MYGSYSFILIYLASTALVISVVTPLLNLTRTGETILRVIFRKKTAQGGISFGHGRTMLFIFLMFTGLIYFVAMPLEGLEGVVGTGLVTGLFVAVIGTMKKQEKENKK